MAERSTDKDTGPPGEMAFTYQWYQRFLQELRAHGYRFRPFSASIGYGDIVLRHDMDLSVDAAVTMAHIEADLGKPVVTSNQATLWDALRTLEVDYSEVGLGTLFDR